MKYSDKIDKELLEDLTDYTILAFVKYKNSVSLIPSYIIEEINEKYGKKQNWNCIYGKDFVTSVHLSSKIYVKFKYGDTKILIYQNE